MRIMAEKGGKIVECGGRKRILGGIEKFCGGKDVCRPHGRGVRGPVGCPPLTDPEHSLQGGCNGRASPNGAGKPNIRWSLLAVLVPSGLALSEWV